MWDYLDNFHKKSLVLMIESITLFKQDGGTYVHLRWDEGHGLFTNIYMVGPSPTIVSVRDADLHAYQIHFQEMNVISEEDFNEQKTAKQNQTKAG
jgi:hypothetical protein